MTTYSTEWFAAHKTESMTSARHVVPILMEFLKPESVCDVGCGTGTWLAVFEDLGVSDFLGIDGDYVDYQHLMISPNKFLCHNLELPLQLQRQFDIVVSLEVAEHLSSSAAPSFIDTLVGLGKIVVFSAAIPFQGGSSHLNEQWQDYWIELFEQRGYACIDYLRSQIWDNEDIGVYYRQNCFVFMNNELLADESWSWLNTFKPNPHYCVVHPKLFEMRCQQRQNFRSLTLRQAISVMQLLPYYLFQSARHHLRPRRK